MIKIKNKDIVVISPQTWDGAIGSNVRDIAKELAKHNRYYLLIDLWTGLPVLKVLSKKMNLAFIEKKFSKVKFLNTNK